MKKLILFALLYSLSLAHPVAYTIDLEATYDQKTKKATIVCKSDSKNKCGLHNFHLLNSKEEIILSAKFPFLKDTKTVLSEEKPTKVIFFLRKISEHQYIVHF